MTISSNATSNASRRSASSAARPSRTTSDLVASAGQELLEHVPQHFFVFSDQYLDSRLLFHASALSRFCAPFSSPRPAPHPHWEARFGMCYRSLLHSPLPIGPRDRRRSHSTPTGRARCPGRRLRREERLEDLGLERSWNAHAAVADFCDDVAIHLQGSHRDAAVTAVALAADDRLARLRRAGGDALCRDAAPSRAHVRLRWRRPRCAATP